VSSNSFGKIFTVTTFGESHGPAIGCVIDGCPPGMALAAEDFRRDLERRATGRSRYTSQRHEDDDVEILSGMYEGRTTGTPIALLIRNVDAKSKDYADIASTFRPGHADYTYWQKYGIRDPRGGGRSSARETTMRVAAAVIAKRWLREKFDLPDDFSANPKYKSLLRMCLWAGEKAKIELSSKEESVISLNESDIGAKDESGSEIYVDIPFARKQLDDLIVTGPTRTNVNDYRVILVL